MTYGQGSRVDLRLHDQRPNPAAPTCSPGLAMCRGRAVETEAEVGNVHVGNSKYLVRLHIRKGVKGTVAEFGKH